MSGTVYPVAETEVGLAIETSRGVAQAPAFWFPVKGPKYKPNLKLLPDETLQGSMVKTYDEVPGLRYDGHGWDGYPYLDTFPVLLRALLGSADNKTAAPSNTTLAASCAAGAASVSTTATIAAGSMVTIGTGMTQEVHLTSAVSGAGPFTVTLVSPMVNPQANGTAVTGLTKHQFSLLNNAAGSGNQPPSVTITDFDGEEWRQLPASQLDTLTIKGTADALDGYTVSWVANPSTTPSAPTPSFTATQAPPGWAVQIGIGGTYLQTLVSWEFSFKRNVKPVPAITGTQQYFALAAFEFEPTAKLTFIEQSGAPQIAQYETGSSQSLDLVLSDVKNGFGMILHCSNAKWTGADLDRSKEWVEVPLDMQLLPSAADATSGGVSPLLATVGNAQTTAY